MDVPTSHPPTMSSTIGTSPVHSNHSPTSIMSLLSMLAFPVHVPCHPSECFDRWVCDCLLPSHSQSAGWSALVCSFIRTSMSHLHSQACFDRHTMHRYLIPRFLTHDKTLLACTEQLLDKFDVNNHPLVCLHSFYIHYSIWSQPCSQCS